jgi:hypothetical protein
LLPTQSQSSLQLFVLPLAVQDETQELTYSLTTLCGIASANANAGNATKAMTASVFRTRM